MQTWNRNKIGVFILLVLLSGIVYANALKNPFHFDDTHHIKDNLAIREIKNIPRFFFDTTAFSTAVENIGHYRPILLITHALNYAIGGLNPVGYHLVNLAFHAGSAFLVFLIVQAMLITPHGSFFIAVSSALIFAVHPFNSEVVNYISARSSVMASFFYLLAFYCWVKYRKNPPVSPFDKGGNRGIYYIASLIAFLLGMLTKEILITLPAILWLYDYYFVPVEDSNCRARFISHLKRSYVYIPFALLIAIPYIIIKILLTGYATIPIAPPRGYYVNLLTQTKVLLSYIKLLFLPLDLTVIHDIAESYSALEGWVVLSLFMLILILCICIWLYFRRGVYARIVSFFIAWFFIGMLPTTIFPLTIILQENRGYLSAVSFAVILGIGIYKVKPHGYRTHLVPIVTLILIITAYSVATVKRNSVWRDDLTLWADAAEKAPMSYMAHHNLGIAYAGLGRKWDAIAEYRKAIELEPRDAQAHYNLGNIYFLDLNLTDLAAYEYNKAIEIEPAYYKAHHSLGVLYWKTGNIDAAIMEFGNTLRINPGYSMSYLSLGKIYEEMNKPAISFNAYQMARNVALSRGEINIANKALEYMDQIKQKITRTNNDGIHNDQ